MSTPPETALSASHNKGPLRILYIEPFEAGSHAAFTRTLTTKIHAKWTVLTLPGRHWKWRARGSAVWFAREHQTTLQQSFDLVFASAYLPLTDLLALCPQLSQVPRVLYFHENQLAYPVRDEHTGERDMHFGFSQLVSCLAATHCWFNSRWNLESFLAEGSRLLSRLPDAVPGGWIEEIRARSRVLHVPLELAPLGAEVFAPRKENRSQGPVILWNHRWEYDKNPAQFFRVLQKMADRGVPFRVAVCGQRFRKAPKVFAQAKEALGERVVHWGYAESRSAYESLLTSAHLALSTADHEFFGISMVEALHFGAFVLVPDKLSYPEIFPPEYRYKEEEELCDRLRTLCEAWTQDHLPLRADRREISEPFGARLWTQWRESLENAALQSVSDGQKQV